MLKSEEQPAPCPPEYPCLKKAERSGVIVLFTEPCVGTVIVAAGDHQLGDYSTDWAMDHFRPYVGDVVLTST